MRNPEKHKCLSCPTMITKGDYCSECSDTPDGRSRLDYRLHVKSKYNKEQIQIHTEYPKDGPLSMMNPSFNNPVVEVINLKEALVRKALIELGWTPPKEETKRLCVDCLARCITPHAETPCDKWTDKPTKESKNLYGCDTPYWNQFLDSEQRFFDPK